MSYLPSAKALIATLCCGPSVSKRPLSPCGLPITKLPAGMPTMTGQSAHSLNSRSLRSSVRAVPIDRTTPSRSKVRQERVGILRVMLQAASLRVFGRVRESIGSIEQDLRHGPARRDRLRHIVDPPIAVLAHEVEQHVARLIEILERGAHLRLVGRLRHESDLELGQLPVLAVDEHVPIDPADHAFGRLLLVLVDQSLEALAVDVRQAGIVII